MSRILAPTSRLAISRKWPQPRAWTPMGLRATCLGRFLEPPDPFHVTNGHILSWVALGLVRSKRLVLGWGEEGGPRQGPASPGC